MNGNLPNTCKSMSINNILQINCFPSENVQQLNYYLENLVYEIKESNIYRAFLKWTLPLDNKVANWGYVLLKSIPPDEIEMIELDKYILQLQINRF